MIDADLIGWMMYSLILKLFKLIFPITTYTLSHSNYLSVIIVSIIYY